MIKRIQLIAKFIRHNELVEEFLTRRRYSRR